MSFIIDSLRFKIKRSQIENMCSDVLKLQPYYSRLLWDCIPRVFEYLTTQSVVKPIDKIDVFDIHNVTHVLNASELKLLSKTNQLGEAYSRSCTDEFFLLNENAEDQIEKLETFFSTNYGWPYGKNDLELFEYYGCRSILRWRNKAHGMQFFRLWGLCNRCNRPFEIRAIKRMYELDSQVCTKFFLVEHFLIPGTLLEKWSTLLRFLKVSRVTPFIKIELEDNLFYAIFSIPSEHPLSKFFLQKGVFSLNAQILSWNAMSQQRKTSAL